MIFIDVETSSKVSVVTHGTYRHAADPDTNLICFCYAVDDGEVQDWCPGDDMPVDLIDAIERGDYLVAHHANYDRNIWDFVVSQ